MEALDLVGRNGLVVGIANEHSLAWAAAQRRLRLKVTELLLRSWRRVKVTERRAAEDFAARMRELADVHYSKAERIRVVLDNLSTHSAGALYHAFPAAEARRVLRRLELRPKARQLAQHGGDRDRRSWPANASIGA